jgi:hypothetical protein
MMDEHVFAAVFLLDEAEALRVVEPFDSSLNHNAQILLLVERRRWAGVTRVFPKGLPDGGTEGLTARFLIYALTDRQF